MVSKCKINMVGYDELPEWVNKDCLSDNGSGKEYATYIIIEDGYYKRVYSDAVEPEDANFSRDFNWVATELRRLIK